MFNISFDGNSVHKKHTIKIINDSDNANNRNSSLVLLHVTDDRSPIHEHFHMIIFLIKSIHCHVHMSFISAEQGTGTIKLNVGTIPPPKKTNSIEFSANQPCDCCLGSESYGRTLVQDDKFYPKLHAGRQERCTVPSS